MNYTTFCFWTPHVFLQHWFRTPSFLHLQKVRPRQFCQQHYYYLTFLFRNAKKHCQIALLFRFYAFRSQILCISALLSFGYLENKWKIQLGQFQAKCFETCMDVTLDIFFCVFCTVFQRSVPETATSYNEIKLLCGKHGHGLIWSLRNPYHISFLIIIILPDFQNTRLDNSGFSYFFCLGKIENLNKKLNQ